MAYNASNYSQLSYTFNGNPVPNHAVVDSAYGLSAGVYPIHIEDWSGCEADTSIILYQPLLLTRITSYNVCYTKLLRNRSHVEYDRCNGIKLSSYRPELCGQYGF